MSNKSTIYATMSAEADRIRAGDVETRTAVYLRLLPQLRAFCKKVCLIRHHPEFVEDCVSEIFIDMPNYRYDKGAGRLLDDIVRTCQRQIFGKVGGVCYSYDEPVQDDDDKATLAKFFGYIDPHFDDEDGEHLTNVLVIIANQKNLNEKARDYLFCRAYCLTPYRGAYNEGKRALSAGVRF